MYRWSIPTYYARIIRSGRRQSFRFTIILLRGFDSKSQCYSPTRDRGTHVCREPATEDGFSSRPFPIFNRIMYVFIASPVRGINKSTRCSTAAVTHAAGAVTRARIVMPTNNNMVRNDVGILHEYLKPGEENALRSHSLLCRRLEPMSYIPIL